MNENIIQIANDILKQVNIVDIISSFIKVTKKGRNYVALCPFHADTNPSMMISPEKQIFKCFVCQTGGDAITFVKKYKNCSYFEAVKIVAQIAGIHDERLENYRTSNSNISDETRKIYNCLSEINKLYEIYLYNTEEGRDGALNYLHNRGLNDEIIHKFKIGYSINDGEKTTKTLLNNGFSLKTIERTGIGNIYGEKIKDNNAGRVIFSITNNDGQVVGFSARESSNDKNVAKYVNSPEVEGGVFHKSNILYNYYNAKDSARREKFIYVVEGFMDAIALDRIGINNVVALMGTVLTQEHIKLLRYLNVEIRLCLDNDNPGQDAMIKIAKQLRNSDIKYVFVSNEQVVNGKDSDEILKNSGPDGLKKYLNTLISEGEFILNYYSKKLNMNSLEDKKTILNMFIPFLAKLKNPLDLELYCNKLSQISGFSLEIIKSQINSYINKISEENDGVSLESLNFKKKDKAITRLELSERQIVRYMLENKDAVEQYNLKLGYLINDDYRQIAILLEEYLNEFKDKDYSTSNIINYINCYKEDLTNDEKEKIINKISAISLDEYMIPPYTVQTFDDCIYVINDEKDWQRSNEVYQQTSFGKSDIEKINQAAALLEKRKELIKKKEKGDNKNGN